MKIGINTPQIKAIRAEVEKRIGNVNGHDKLARLESMIEVKCKEHISITTLQRLWGYSTRKAENISERILDIIAKFIDAENWENFCRILGESEDSEIFESKDIISCKDLKEGSRLRLGWLPDRTCEIEYLGGNRFVAVKTENATIRPGDTFRCIQFQKGRELYMDNFTRNGEPESFDTRYVVGKTNGLTTLEHIKV